ncbi:MAG: hypothetical protein JWO13_917 [Acidobacteriales bacterium]|nr:hypothetical protein [Terriglobales bacterium]
MLDRLSLQSQRFAFAVILAAVIAVQGCSSEKPADSADSKPKAAESAKPQPKAESAPQLQTGREAFQKVYASARIWAPDAQPLTLESQARKGDKDGQAALWSAQFASASKRSIRTFQWSGATGEDAPEQGISPGKIDVYSPENASTQPFSLNFLKTDSDKAFEVAQKHGGANVMKKNPTLVPKFRLWFDRPHSRLLWKVIYGASEDDAKLKLLVDASSGTFVGIEK